MSHIRLKTKYKVQGAYGSTEERILYADHNNSCDIITFYYEDGDVLMAVEEIDNNIFEAISKLYAPHKNRSELIEGVEHMNEIDRKICGL